MYARWRLRLCERGCMMGVWVAQNRGNKRLWSRERALLRLTYTLSPLCKRSSLYRRLPISLSLSLSLSLAPLARSLCLFLSSYYVCSWCHSVALSEFSVSRLYCSWPRAFHANSRTLCLPLAISRSTRTRKAERVETHTLSNANYTTSTKSRITGDMNACLLFETQTLVFFSSFDYTRWLRTLLSIRFD